MSAIGVKKGFNQRWGTIDTSTIQMKQLFSDYRQVWFTLKVNPDADQSYLDLSLIQADWAQSSMTVSQFIVANGDTTLPTVATKPIIETKYVKWGDANTLRYHIEPVHPQYGVNVDADQRSALLLTKTDTHLQYSNFIRKAIVSVNGFWHLCDTDGTSGVLVYGGGDTYNKTKLNQCGILSFADLGSIDCIPISSSMIHKRLTPEMVAGTVAPEPYSMAAYINVSRDLTGKTVLLVLGGYLHTPDSDIFQRVADNEFKINFNKYPLLDRYYESSQYLNLDSLGLASTPRNLSQIDQVQLYSDTVIEKYLTLSQSYLIVLDTSELFTEKRYVRRTGRPGTYVAYQKPEFPIVSGIGRMPEYRHKQEANGAYALWCYNDLIRPRIYSTTTTGSLSSTGSASTTTPIDPEIHTGVYFLAIGCDLKKQQIVPV